LRLEVNENAGKNGLLEHMSEIAGMKGVAIGDLSDPPVPAPPPFT